VLTRGERLYRFALRDLAQPALHALTGRDFTRRRRFLERSQWWSVEQLRELQWRELQRLLLHAWQTIPYYRRVWQHAGAAPEEIRTWDDFARLPVLTKQQIRENYTDLRSTMEHGRMIPFSTGGSTGAPLQFEISRSGWDWRSAALERAWGWAGAVPGVRTLLLWGAPLQRPSWWTNLRSGLFRNLRREVIVPTFHQSEELWDSVYRLAHRFRPRVLAGYAASLEGYLRFLQQKGRGHNSILSVISAAESAGPALRQLSESVLRAPLFETYSAREFFNIASECPVHGGMHISAENLIVELQPADGGPDELLITDLRNDGMPLIRYCIEDGGEWQTSPCPCGRGLPILRRVDGRIYQTLLGRDGRVVPGEFFGYLFLDFRSVRQYQVVQFGAERLEVRVALWEPLAPAERERILSACRAVFGESMPVEVVIFGYIPRLPSGKRQVTVRLPA
jgi:phenylacetate-CoA ligase